MSGNIKKRNEITELSRNYKESTDNLRGNKKSSKKPLTKEAQRKVDLEFYAIGQRLCHQRKLVNMTQDAAGEALRRSKQMVSLHENGHKLSFTYLEKYSLLYKCSIEQFFVDGEIPKKELHTIDQAAAMSRVIGKIKLLYKHDYFHAFTFLDVDYREIQRWAAFARQNASCDKESNDIQGIQSVPLLRFVQIALELETPIAEILFGKIECQP